MLDSPGLIDEYVQDKQTDLANDYYLMDIDFDIWNLDPHAANRTSYQMEVDYKTAKHGSQINIISNEPRTFADNVQARMSSADMQIAVRMPESGGEDKRDDIGKLERLFHFGLEKADERLRRKLQAPLRASLIWYSCLRAGAGVQVLIYKDGDNVIFDILPLDPRWLTPEAGVNGIVKCGYETFRSLASIQSEYGFDITKSLSKKNDNSVINFWEEDKGKFYNSVKCGGVFLKEPTLYDVPSMPIVIIPTGTRPNVARVGGSNTGIYGESLYSSCRDILSVRNRYVSMVANHADIMANQGVINYRDAQGQDIEKLNSVPGGVLNVDRDHNRIEPSPTVVNMLGWLNDQVEGAMLPKIDINKPPSGTLYNLVESTSARVYNPQLALLSNIYADMCRLIEEQMIAGRLKVKIEGKEKDKYFEVEVKPVDLKKPHTINVEFTASTPWSQIDTYQVADMAKRIGIPDNFIWEYILKLPDPKGVSDQNAIEMAEKSPKLAMVQAIKALMKNGRQEEAQSVMEDLYNLVASEQQELMNGQSQPTGATTPPEGAI